MTLHLLERALALDEMGPRSAADPLFDVANQQGRQLPEAD